MRQISRRSENRNLINRFYSVEIHVDGNELINQFVLYDMSTSGLCFLIEKDSSLLEKIKVGETYKMKYYPVNILGNVEYINTRICHITKPRVTTFEDHFMVGLSLEN